MTSYSSASNPYRASTGSMPLHVTTTPSSSTSDRHADYYNATKYEERCDSCGSTYTDEHLLRLNTPFSAPPYQVCASLLPPTPTHRSRRSSTSSAHQDPPMVLTRYPHGALVLEPAVSYTHERRRRTSVSASDAAAAGPSAVPRTHQHHHANRHHEARKSWSGDITVTADSMTVRGTTKLPRQLVNKDAVKQMGYPYKEDRVTGAITVQRVLEKDQVQELVELTEQLRAKRHSSKDNQEKCVRIITHPTETFIHEPDAPVAQQPVVAGGRQYYHGNQSYSSSSNSAYLEPNPRHSTYRLTRPQDREAGHRRSASTSAMPTATTVRVGPNGRREVVVLR